LEPRHHLALEQRFGALAAERCDREVNSSHATFNGNRRNRVDAAHTLGCGAGFAMFWA
jgi:hypothetical protein